MDRPAAWRENAVDLEVERPFRIGGATVDPVSREAVYQGGQERLQPQTLKVLIALARRSGEVVTRSELIDSCWGGRIVGEDVINRSISILRDFAQRSGGFAIETIPKAGYRLRETFVPAAAKRFKLMALGAVLVAACAIALLATGWLNPRPPGPLDGREMQVQLAGFTALSDTVSPSFLRSLEEETVAAFADDGAIGITSRAAGGTGRTSGYQLSGSVALQGEAYKVLLRIDNGRTGASLWSRAFVYPPGNAAEVARLVALDLANMTRCGFGRSITHPRAMPDDTLRLIFAACENDGTINWQLDRALDYARRVTIASPDFSVGWSGLAGIAVVLRQQKPGAEAERIEAEARHALDTALRIDPGNSEAWALRSYFLPAGQFARREESLKRAIAARPLDCGCEHHAYGLFLSQVGRLADSEREFQRGVDIMHLNAGLYANLARAQFALGKRAKALETLESARRVARDPGELALVQAEFAIGSGDHSGALEILGDPALADDPDARELRRAAEALRSGDGTAIAGVRTELRALTLDPETNGRLPIVLLARLGDTNGALLSVQRLATTSPASAYRTLFDPALARAQRDRAFWETAGKLGLVSYWRTSRQLPDLCTSREPPGACSTL